MIKKGLIVFLLICSFAFLVACGSSGEQTNTGNNNATNEVGGESAANPDAEGKSQQEGLKSIRFGTSPSGSPLYALTVGLGEIIDKHAGINTTVEPVGGSDANVFAIKENRVDFALLNGLSAFNGYHGNSVFETPVDIRLVAQGQPSIRQIVVRIDSGIESPKDLAGKKFAAIRPANNDIEEMADAVLKAYGVDRKDVNMISAVTNNEVMEALNIGSVHAAILPGSLGSAQINQLLTDGKTKLLTIDRDMLQPTLDNLSEAWSEAVIPAGTYPEQDNEIIGLAFPSVIIAGKDVPEETVHQVVKTMDENLEEFARGQRSASEWTIDNSLTNPKVPFHPGAIRYFKELGKWTDELEALQNKLLQ